MIIFSVAGGWAIKWAGVWASGQNKWAEQVGRSSGQSVWASGQGKWAGEVQFKSEETPGARRAQPICSSMMRKNAQSNMSN